MGSPTLTDGEAGAIAKLIGIGAHATGSTDGAKWGRTEDASSPHRVRRRIPTRCIAIKAVNGFAKVRLQVMQSHQNLAKHKTPVQTVF
jgi:hypothetical protein